MPFQDAHPAYESTSRGSEVTAPTTIAGKLFRATEKESHQQSPTQRPQLKWSQKLGKTAIAVIVVGYVIILSCLAMLVLLWFSDTTNPM
jgi:uncharacterized protein (DUF983 family)